MCIDPLTCVHTIKQNQKWNQTRSVEKHTSFINHCKQDNKLRNFWKRLPVFFSAVTVSQVTNVMWNFMFDSAEVCSQTYARNLIRL